MQNTWTVNVDEVSRSEVDIRLDANIDDDIMNQAEAAGFIDQLFKGVSRSGQSLKSFVESTSSVVGCG
jgi:hypothetical protein